MSNYHVFECDRCLKREEHATNLPQYWATIKVTDTNRTSSGTGQYERDLCQRCMDEVRKALEVIPRKVSAVA